MTSRPEPPDYPAHLVIRQRSSRVVYQNSSLSVREDEFQRPDGSQDTYAVLDKPDFSLVIPVENDGFHLVEQFRYPIGQRSWEFPQGSYPDGRHRDPELMARGELLEETGLHADRLRHLGFLYSAQSLSSQGFHVYLADELRHGIAHRELEEQDMRQTWMSRSDFEDQIRNGTITDDATLAGYLLLQLVEHDGR